MKDDPEVQLNDSWSNNNPYTPKRRQIGSDNRKPLRMILGAVVVLILVVGIIYFVGKLGTGGEASLLEPRVVALEQRIAGLERQLTEFQGRLSTMGPDPAVVERVEALAVKIETLEQQRQAAVESKAKVSPPPKPSVSAEKQYHTVQKGETLYRISIKYRISVKELRRLNNLSADQPLRIGQKLLVSP